jgi:hypothetical protein
MRELKTTSLNLAALDLNTFVRDFIEKMKSLGS